MCGIAGSINLAKIPLEKIYPFMAHRGPNDSGSFYEMSKGGLISLFHARLSIQDLSECGHQPMQKEEAVIVFNGEIYNHKDLRNELDCEFKSSSDTETLLALYLKYGMAFLEKLDGMFAFAIYDRKKQKVFFVRDRMGKKPLFIYQDKESLAFSSELNTLLCFKKLQIDYEGLKFFLQSGFFYHDGTPYLNCYSLPNASYGEYDLCNHKLSIKPYFNLLDYYLRPKITDEKEAIKECEEILIQSLKRRIESSDLEVGAFLSGGIDSSLIVALASKIKPNLRTFTISFSGAYDESHLAQITAKTYGTNHTTLKITPNLKNDVEKILQNYGRPFADSSAIPSFYVAKEAKKHLSVVLNGDGADELFGGYRRYVGHLLVSKIKPFGFLSNMLPSPKEKKSLYNYFYRLLQMAKAYQNDFLAYYLLATTDIFCGYFSFENSYNNDFQKELTEIFNAPLSKLSQMLYLDSKNLLLSDLLPKMDIATMANSLEGRSPFLSKEMVEFAPRLSDDLKIRGKTTKYLLRKLAQIHLDKEIVNAPKRGFEVPLKQWVNYELKELIMDRLSDSKIACDFLSKEEIYNLCFKGEKYGEEKRAKMLWSLYALEEWYAYYLKR
ncbi:asparagine synthase (glutamine-hydrolyzing) [Helicobacter burdigaliensis]|uniref:asparagine synthase (glutamine-hydrolyzing) n=1 Tax=Helicobacter burdigaliensis TaxID=2315334 RepID=UPI000EF6885B|nr:asparagine synthase (glutamine-hydrolyzing) [Helicobacter burdigaliensis]